MRMLVDGMNVIGSRPDGWWRDRRGAMQGLVAALCRYQRDTGDEVTVVLDSRAFDVGGDGVSVRFAPGGRNAGDDDIVRIVAADAAPGTLTVVTSDKELAARAWSSSARA